MREDLVKARDAALAHYDAAAARHKASLDDAFRLAVGNVIDEFERIIAATDSETSRPADPIELSRTLRWLGDLYYDQGLLLRRRSWERAAQAYLRAESLLVNQVAPVELAKLDLNFGNTISALSEGTEVGFLEAAQVRYERAIKVFRDNFLPMLAKVAEDRLETVHTQLKVSRHHALTQRNCERLQNQTARLPAASALEQNEIKNEVARISGSLDAQSIGADMRAALNAMTKHTENVPGMNERLRALEASVNNLAVALSAMPTPPQAVPEDIDPLAAVAGLLFHRIRTEAAAGIVSPDRAEHLNDVLGRFMATIPAATDDLQTRQAKTSRMRELMREITGAVRTPSSPLAPPLLETRAGRAAAMLDSLKAYLLSELVAPMLPSGEAATGRELFAAVAKLQGLVHQAAHDDRRIASLEERAWRVATDVQQHARRYNLVIARPDFAVLAEHAAAKSLFVSGGEDLRVTSERLAERDGIQLFLEARRGDVAQERWSQLLAAGVAVFDIGLPDGSMRAQACYELGLALAVGKSSVTVARKDTVIPFDVELPPIVFGDKVEENVRALQAGVNVALSAVTRGGRSPQFGGIGDAALVALQRHIARSGAPAHVTVQLSLAQANASDAVGLRRSIEGIIGSVGADAPAVLLPAWPPAAPDRARPPLCFHVMPFRQKWSKSTRNAVAETCRRHGWGYSRGDESLVQRIIPGIWQELCRASAVIIDVTGHNPNVALELGLVHALGCPYRVVARGNPKDYTFPSLSKVQVHGYGDGPTARSLDEIVTSFLGAVEQNLAKD